MYAGYPMTVLVNENTASAAELMAAALRDYEKATLVGVKTHGKGVSQQVISLEQWGYEGALRLTVAHYNPPSGVNYHGVGVEPHVTVEQSEAAEGKHFAILAEAEDTQLQAALTAVNQ